MHTYYDVYIKLRFSLPEHLVHVAEDKPTEFSCIQYMYMLPPWVYIKMYVKACILIAFSLLVHVPVDAGF